MYYQKIEGGHYEIFKLFKHRLHISNLEASSKEEIIRKIVNKVAEDDKVVGGTKDEIIKIF